jgi:type I restriction enzyme M protein
MAIKKSQLYSSIWQGCDELRGGMDASQYKDYVLVLLFVRYVSDKYAGQKNALVVVPEGGSFSDLTKLKGQPNIGEGINKALSALAEANGLKGVIDTVDFNDEDKLGKGKEMQDRLSNLIAIFENPGLELSGNRADGDDLLGDAYEYLMKNFAVQSGKAKGQFYTPAEVSRIIAKVIDAKNAQGRTQTAYDPTCGSGSLLLKVAAEAPHGIAIYGQELDNATAALAIMNMWLHNEPTAEIKKGQSTLSSPLFLNKDSTLKTFNYVVANPPFSYKAWRTGFDPEHDQYERFTGYGIPPKKNGDFAFLLHIIRSLKSTGKGAVVLPHGVLFRGSAEAQVRKNIIQRGYMKGIIGLPANLFYGTSIPACIIVLDKEEAASRRGIFMIDASKGFMKDGNKNRLRERDIRKIVDVFEGKLELPKYSRFVLNEEIQKEEYNLNIPRYIDTQEPEDIQDIEAHLKGGIPNADIEELAPYWDICPTLKSTLFKGSAREGYSELTIGPDEVKPTILSHKEFEAFRALVLHTFATWRKKTAATLKNISTKDRPKAIIQNITDDLLAAYAGTRLIDKYDIYQHLMTYWAETMQDDAYIITADGWSAGNQVIRLQREAKGKKKDIAGLSGLEGRLIPLSLLINTYFAAERAQLDKLDVKLEQIGLQMGELKDEYSGEEGLLAEVIENDKITKGAVQKRIKEIKADPDYGDELIVLEQYQALFEEEAGIKKAIKEAEQDLEQKVIAKYPALSLEEIKTLVVERKWMDTIQVAVESEMDRLSQRLAGRVKELAERYQEPLPELTTEVETFSAKVDDHLEKMGFTFKI